MEQMFESGYALLIGVGESAFKPWSLPVAVQDANALRAVLTDPQRCAYLDDEEHVRLLHDQLATRQGILDGLAWLRSCATNDRAATVIVFFSGHGCIDQASGRYFLLPHDVTPFDIAGTALAADDFNSALRAVPASRLLVIVDSCHAAGMASAKDGGSDSAQFKLPAGFHSAALPAPTASTLARGSGRVVFASARGDQKAYVRPDGTMSIYTWRLVEALQGAGCNAGETSVHLSHLMNYLGATVPSSAQSLWNAEQTPFFDASTEDFAVALVAGGKGLKGKEAVHSFQPGPQTTTVAGVIAQDHSVAAADQGVAIRGDNNQVRQINAHIYQELHGDLHLAASSAQENEQGALTAYLRAFAAKHRRLSLRGIDWQASDPTQSQRQMDLQQVFVMLDTTALALHADEVDNTDSVSPPSLQADELSIRQENGANDRRLSVIEAIGQNRQVVLLGSPGAGKSTVLSYIGLILALQQLGWDDAKQLLPGWSMATKIVPIHVLLRDFARQTKGLRQAAQPHHLWRFISSQLRQQNLSAMEASLVRSLEEGNVILLLDGLDEIPNAKQAGFVRDAVVAFIERYPHCRAVLTCRRLTYLEQEWQLPGLPSFVIAPLSDAKVEMFITRWYAELHRTGSISQRDAQELTTRLHGAIARADMQQLASSPLLLTVMALVHTHKGRLPDVRALLYEETIDLMLLNWEQIKTSGEEAPRLRRLLAEANRTDVDLKRILWRIAYQVHETGAAASDKSSLSDIHEYTLERALADLHPQRSRDWAVSVIQTLKLRSGLLLERAPAIYAFPHRTFQEYMAGAHLAAKSDFARQVAQLIGSGNYWRQTILLAVGRLMHVAGDLDRPLALAAELLPARAPRSNEEWRKAWLAADVLDEMGLNRVMDSSLGDELVERSQQRMSAFLRSDSFSPAERTAAGSTLARLGDQRFHKDALCLPNEPLLGFVEIPAGPFIMGDPPQEHVVTLPPFYISRFPVTVGQYRAFVADTGMFPDDPSVLAAPNNFPLSGVSWMSALEYCNWLNKKLLNWEHTPPPLADLLRREASDGPYWRVTLPSEAEWEKASRGGLLIPAVQANESANAPRLLVKNPLPRRTYPWGDDVEPNCANFDSTAIGSTSPVGCFPLGASPYGVEELSGNVWEWTRTLWGRHVAIPDYAQPYDPRDGRERWSAPANIFRVLRGGTFYNSAEQITCTAHERNYPDLWISHIGFRLVLRPSI